MTDFDAYKTYLAIKQHFNRKGYDYFKYNGKVNAKESSFNTRKDKIFFSKLKKKKDLEGFLVANFIHYKYSWVKTLILPEAHKVYDEWIKRQQSISYIFKQEIATLPDDLNLLLEINDGHPTLLQMHLANDICLETLIIMDKCMDFFQYWDSFIEEQFIWPEIRERCDNYAPFMKYDLEKCKQILKDRFL
jgi:hypothetical protein